MKFLLTALVFCCALSGTAQQTSVLFIGNSYIYTADLPGTLKNLALAAGDTIYHESNTPGGSTFEQHSTNTTTLGKIASRNWDYVVLQEQSQIPAFPPSQVAWQSYPFAAVLVDSIRSNYACTEPLFFMTWGRRDGDPNNCGGYPPLCTFEGMNTRLRQSYMQMGLDNDATVAPCGVAWHQMLIDNNTFWNGLYSGDGSHPSAWGTYLNACVFYATIFQKSPVGIPYYSNIGQQDAEVLQQLAHDVVIDNLSNWYIGHQDVISSANYTVNGELTVNFSANSINATQHYWDFDDGTTSTQENPMHTYTSTNPSGYSVVHVARSSCDSDTSYLHIEFGSFSSVSENDLMRTEVYQTGNILNVKNMPATGINMDILDCFGRSVRSARFAQRESGTIPLDLPSGIYLIRLTSRSNTVTSKVFLH